MYFKLNLEKVKNHSAANANNARKKSVNFNYFLFQMMITLLVQALKVMQMQIL